MPGCRREGSERGELRFHEWRGTFSCHSQDWASKSVLVRADVKSFGAKTEWKTKRQSTLERVYQALILSAAAAGFAHGFATQSFAATFYWWLAASLLAGLLTVPGWPALYRRDAVAWLERLPTAEEDAADAAEEFARVASGTVTGGAAALQVAA